MTSPNQPALTAWRRPRSCWSISGCSSERAAIRTITIDSSSAAEDAALSSLQDACQIGLTHNLRVIGGQMVLIYRELYPEIGLPNRATADTDAAIENEFAASGKIHAQLESIGYRAVSGNSYRLGSKQIDLLTGNFLGKFRTEILGGRAFDSGPGVQLALDTKPVLVKLKAQLLAGDKIELIAAVPPLDVAVCLKALSYTLRLADKDLVDLYHLLLIADHELESGKHPWTLAEPARGERLKAQKALQKLADNQMLQRTKPSPDVDRLKLAALIRRLVLRPNP